MLQCMSLLLAHLGGHDLWPVGPVVGVVLPPLWHQGHKARLAPHRRAPHEAPWGWRLWLWLGLALALRWAGDAGTTTSGSIHRASLWPAGRRLTKNAGIANSPNRTARGHRRAQPRPWRGRGIQSTVPAWAVIANSIRWL